MASLNNRLNKVVDRIDAKLIKLEKEAKASKVPPFGMERLSFKDSLKRLGQLSPNERQRTMESWTPQEMRRALNELGGGQALLQFLDQ